jgi:transposase
MYSEDIRWRAVALIYIYNLPFAVALVLGISLRTAHRWYNQFLINGHVLPKKKAKRSARWPVEAVEFVGQYCKEHPCFLLDELKEEVKLHFPSISNISHSTICRLLNFDLQLTRKVLTKRAREATPQARQNYYDTLKQWYSYPEQLVFLDETSKDGRDAMRRYARSRVNTPALVKIPFSRGKRVSAVAAFSTDGFMGFDTTPGTFTRGSFHESFKAIVLPKLQPWPLPRSIVIMDNAKIHCYPELFEMIHRCGAKLFFLPPYSPDLNPIEFAFSFLKKYIQKHYYLSFRKYPSETLKVCFRKCTENMNLLETFRHCGYSRGSLIKESFFTDNTSDEMI